MTLGQLIRDVNPRVLFGVPSLRNDLPYSFVFHQQHHFDTSVRLCSILSHFAAGSRNGDIAENSAGPHGRHLFFVAEPPRAPAPPKSGGAGL
jgi:hypothetical protein